MKETLIKSLNDKLKRGVSDDLKKSIEAKKKQLTGNKTILKNDVL